MLLGCGSSNPYPKAQAPDYLGKPGVCFVTGEKIPSVQESNVVVVDGVMYFVKDSDAEKTLHKRLENEKRRP
jgi:hypothetical protein